MTWEDLEDIKFEDIGKVPEDFKHEQRLVRSHGLIKDPSLILKFYEMYIEGQPLDKGEIEATKELLLSEIVKEIKPYSGMGFAILSEDMLNIARWDKEYPIVLRNDIYRYQDKCIDTAKLEDIRKIGAFCVWELSIVDFESRAWKRYLKSEKEEMDKKIYLNSTIEGQLY